MGIEAHIADCSHQQLSIEEGHMNISSRVSVPSCDAEVSKIYAVFIATWAQENVRRFDISVYEIL